MSHKANDKIVDDVRDRELLPCPFKEVEKEIGHNPYILKEDGMWYIQCTCGARSPISPTGGYAIQAWNTRIKEQK